jgi:hypothetical protein
LDAQVFAAASISLYVKAPGKMAGDSVYPVWSTKGAKMQQQGHARRPGHANGLLHGESMEAPCCVGSRGASFGTPCHYICVTLSRQSTRLMLLNFNKHVAINKAATADTRPNPSQPLQPGCEPLVRHVTD